MEYPTETELKFENFKNQSMLPFIIYADTESILESSNKGAAYQEHIPISYCIYVESIDNRWQSPSEWYTGEDCMEVFMKRIDELNKELRDVFKKTMLILRLTTVDKARYDNAMKCYCCDQPFKENDDAKKKVKDHCHITGQYRGAACSYCNLNNLNIIANSHKIQFVFHNLKGYDMHHIFQNLQGRETSIIASTREKILTAEIGGSTEENDQGQLRTVRGVKYIDSLSFLNASLGTLATYLPKEQFTSVK